MAMLVIWSFRGGDHYSSGLDIDDLLDSDDDIVCEYEEEEKEIKDMDMDLFYGKFRAFRSPGVEIIGGF